MVKRLDKLDRIEDVEIERPNIRINFAVDRQPGKIICTLKNVSKSFPGVPIVENTGAEIDRGDKIALIGANGKGKSTMLRIIAGAETFEGEREWGHNVVESFYAQHQLEALNLNNNVLEELQDARSGKNDLELRSLLGAFLFSGDSVEKKVKVLSGGEKARVALAKTIASKANFLMLDEPTNHLDIHSVDLLVESLNKYEGSLILVSHDRYFISRLANKIWEIDNQKIREFKGTYAEWEDWKERRAKAEAEMQREEKLKSKSEPAVAATPKVEKKEEKQAAPALSQDQKKELQKVKNKFKQLEEKLAVLNKNKNELEASLADPVIYSDKQKFLQAEAAYQAAVKELKEANDAYEQVFEQLVTLEEKA
ncbi:MAG: ATP-binding cassette domain-containing protein [Ferruginibacter sp.]